MTDQEQHSQHHRTLNVPDVPLDAANQSLADALQASFNVLKVIMIVLLVLFTFTGLKCVQEHQRAVVVRFGKLDPTVRSAGLSWAWPFPIDETVRVGVTAETLKFDHSHWFRVRAEEEGLSLNRLMRTGGLDPRHDGSLVTGDRGLAHVQWSLIYSIEDLAAFVANVGDANDEKVEELVQALLENAAVRVASGLSAAEITQTRTDQVARRVKLLINEELDRLRTGIRVTTVEIPLATVPLQTRQAFVHVTRAESVKTAKIRQAEQQRTELLNAAAGAAHQKLLDRLDRLEAARAGGDLDRVAELDREIDDILEHEATGRVGASIRSEQAYYTRAVQGLRGDVEQFQALLAEYQRAPRLLISRLWQETERRILSSDGVTKYYLPAGQKEVRIRIPPDPRAKRQAEEKKYRGQEEGAGASDPGLELGSPGTSTEPEIS